MDQQALTIQELIEAYKIGRSKLYEEIAAGRLKIYKIGRSTRISRAAAAEWQRNLEAQAQQVQAQQPQAVA